ncbi:hypothetical protein [Rufibacter sp. XAAS-G3-1]|uniref:hypothetical protein n=1 Tax=Rufibacter sp. XAAS-G3-1 TaxID=2729134 RepID=UPI0015E73137|nr:hypothetical protein [Rufibacter sp. XAAS-G3-1]
MLYITLATLGIMQFSFGLLPIGVFGAFLLVFAAIISGIVSGAIGEKTKTSKWFYFISFLTFVSIVCFFIIANFQNIITDNRANKIITALEQYREDKGQYPQNLETLTNEQIKSIPPTAYGVLRQNSHYNFISSDKFKLYFYSYIGVEHTYDSTTKEWRADD